jgi:hypothetical protein
MARRKLGRSGSSFSREILVLLMNPPEGMPGRARPGGKSPPVSIHSGGMVSREGEDAKFTSTLSLAPVFYGLASLVREVCKKCSGMLNVLPYMVPVKRETQHLVAQKW